MISEDIRELQRATPFEPSTVVTSDGKALDAKHPDYLLISPGNQTVWIFSDEIHREVVAVPNITRIALGGAKQKARARKR